MTACDVSIVYLTLYRAQLSSTLPYKISSLIIFVAELLGSTRLVIYLFTGVGDVVANLKENMILPQNVRNELKDHHTFPGNEFATMSPTNVNTSESKDDDSATIHVNEQKKMIYLAML